MAVAENGTATSTILFTDVVGSTQLRGRLGEAASDQLFRAHERLLRQVVATHGGRVVKAAGDGIMAAFDAASDAVLAAVTMQREVTAADQPVEIRIGVAAGDVSWEDGDCFGLPVVVASRLEGDAEGGQILVSHIVASLAGDRAGSRYEALGPRPLRGLSDPVEVFEVAWDPPISDDPAGDRTPSALPPQLAILSGLHFVGRSEEWDVLDSNWVEIRQSGRRVVLIGGEAGAGKTRLASEFARFCHGSGATILYGSCDSELSLPYQPWVQALDHFIRSNPDVIGDERLAPALSELLVLLPNLDRLVAGLVRPANVDPEADQYRLFAAVTDVLVTASADRPVVVLIDDLHWADGPTLALLRHVARSGAVENMLFVGTFRDTADEITDPLASCLADLRRLDGVSRLRLGGLDRSSVEHFVEEATGQQLDAGLRQVAALLSERSAGNAFYMGELWQHLLARGTVVRSGSRWIAHVETDTVSVPDSVKEVVAARLTRLSGVALRLVQLAAVAGQRVELRVLTVAAGVSEIDVAAPLDELLEAGLLAEAGGLLLTYQFQHALVRDSVVDAISSMRRAQLHLEVAGALESVHEADRRSVLADLARHFEAAAALGGSDKAVYYARRAGIQAMRSAAYDEAATHFRAGIALAAVGTRERVELLLDLGTVETRAGWYLESKDTANLAFDEARSIGSAELAARAAIVFEQAIHMPGLPGEPAVEMVSAAIEMLGDDDAPLRVRLQGSLARSLAHAGRTAEADEEVEKALAMARRVNDTESLRAALEAALIATSEPERLLTLAAELEALSVPGTDPWHELYATSNQIRALVCLGRLAEATTMLERHVAFSERGRYPAFQFVGHAFEAVLLLAAGRFDAAEEAAERAHTLGSAGNSPFDAGVYGLQMFAIRREQGRLEEVVPVLKLVAAAQTDQPMWRPGLAALYTDLGMLDEARTQFEALAPGGFRAIPRDSVWPACAAFLADVCVALDDASRARVIYEELSPFAGRNLMAGMTISVGPAERFLAKLAALLGQVELADTHFVSALALAERSGSPVWQARVLHDHARLHATQGRTAEAVDLGRQARQIALMLGMKGLASAPVPGLDAGGGGDRGVWPAAMPVEDALFPDGLSGREVEVLQLVAAGCSNREIGERLFISPNTAANHVRAILRKTSSSNRAEAATYAARQDLLGS